VLIVAAASAETEMMLFCHKKEQLVMLAKKTQFPSSFLKFNAEKYFVAKTRIVFKDLPRFMNNFQTVFPFFF
jgi:hypothetical protein